jgi:signal-transduction protein with cAMP-binding, CBS, and nucleotidyltransferase domain
MINREILHDAVICKEKDNILEVSRIIRDTKARHIIVVDKNLKPLGIISPFDINNRVVAEKKDVNSTFAKDIMTKPIETIELKESYETAAEKMVHLETFTLPVTEKGKLIGVLDYSVVFRKVCEVKNDN